MSTPLTEVGNLLQARNCGVLQTSLFLGQAPMAPDDALIVTPFPAASDSPEYVQESYMPIAETVHMQILSRSKSYSSAEELAYRAWRALAVIVNATLGSTKYRSIKPLGSPVFMGRDQEDRALIGFDVIVDKEVSVV